MKILTPEQDVLFLKEILDAVIDERIYDLPTEYVERIRYIPRGLSPKPGFFEFSFTPYWIEVFNNLATDSGVQIIAVMKAAQIGYTVAILENAILYFMGSNPKYVQFITSDNKLAEEMVKERINPMIKHAGLENLLYAQDKAKGSRLTGNTMLHKQYPHGSINFTGANNPDAFRGRTKQVTLGDEVDTFKDDKKEGSKIGLITNRSNAFSESRKMVWGSTPLIQQTSVIYNLYLQGDQRNYYVPCPHCGKMQVLKWHGVTEDGVIYGIDFKHEKGIPIYETVHYKCPHCLYEIKDHEKTIFILEGNGEWRPTAKPTVLKMRSYWLNALYSPPGVYSWEKIVEDWAKCWDLERNRMSDKDKYREFRNTKQGLPFEEKGESISYEKAIIHRRTYAKGTIDNELIEKDCGCPALLVLSTVDVQKNNLFVDVKAYSMGGATYTIDFFSIDGVTEEENSESWIALDDFICNKVYVDKQGRQYRIINTFIDSSKFTKYVYNFCSQYSTGVFPIKGERYISGGITYDLFSKKVIEKSGCSAGYRINTTRLKDQISKVMQRLEWNTGEYQPPWYPNFPEDLRDDYFKQFQAENKVDEYDKLTNKYKGSYWRQRGSMDNHAFDTYVYHLANIELVAEQTCINVLGLDCVDWKRFFAYANESKCFYH